ncbi:LysR family transcriptional regulator [Pseudaeromonas sp. ZJS20]|uniref:LysR family transcriptional regulator n=1 Tax=Pseudaeromonas aegiceratis TaxID=3153928 RepID=UPI00390C446C
MKTPYSLDDLRLFWVVAHQGSLTAAATQLAMPVSTLSRRLARLEQQLGLRLLHRNAHRLSLTDTGSRYLARCDPLFAELNTISGELDDERQLPRGPIRVAAPINLAQAWLGPALGRFLLRYPHIQVDLTLSNSNIDLSDQGVDLAIRVGEPQIAEWIARPLGQIPMGLFARHDSPAVASLQAPEQLGTVPLVVGKPVTRWRLWQPETGERLEYRPGENVRLAVDDLATVAQAVASGLGVGLVSRSLMAPWLASGEVVPVMAPWQGQPRPCYLLYRDRAPQVLRLRLLVDYLLGEALPSL